MKRTVASIVVLLCFAAPDLRIAAQQTPEWGSGVAPFAFALIGDMPYGASGRRRSTGWSPRSIGTTTSTL